VPNPTVSTNTSSPIKLIAPNVFPMETLLFKISIPSNFVTLTFITSAIISSRFPPLPKNAVALTIPVIFASPFTYNLYPSVSVVPIPTLPSSL
jgi:hypothetical protein